MEPSVSAKVLPGEMTRKSQNLREIGVSFEIQRPPGDDLVPSKGESHRFKHRSINQSTCHQSAAKSARPLHPGRTTVVRRLPASASRRCGFEPRSTLELQDAPDPLSGNLRHLEELEVQPSPSYGHLAAHQPGAFPRRCPRRRARLGGEVTANGANRPSPARPFPGRWTRIYRSSCFAGV